MQFIKGLLRGLASAGLKFSLTCAAFLAVTSMVFGTSAFIKKALRDSKLYDHVIDNVVATQTPDNLDVDTSVSLGAPAVKQAAKTAFSPSLIQNSTEQVIDSTYEWLQGKSDKPGFKLDFSAAKLQFATAAADNAAARARQLPPCTLQQNREFAASGTIDPFGIPCLPAGVDADSIKNRVISDLANNEELLKSPVITADNLMGKDAIESLRWAPKAYRWMMVGPWVLGGIGLLSGLLLVLLHDEKRRGVRTIATTFLGSGIFIFIGTLVLTFVLKQANKPNGSLTRLTNVNGLESYLLSFFTSIVNAFGNRLLIFGVGYAAVGTVMLLGLHFTKPNGLGAGAGGEQPLTGLDTPTHQPLDPPVEPMSKLDQPDQ